MGYFSLAGKELQALTMFVLCMQKRRKTKKIPINMRLPPELWDYVLCEFFRPRRATIHTNDTQTYAITTSGEIMMWGEYGSATPTQIFQNCKLATTSPLSTNELPNILLNLYNGNLGIYDTNSYMQALFKNTMPFQSLTEIELPRLENVTVKEISLGTSHMLALMTDNTLLVCGNNMSGQLGLGHQISQSQFVPLKLNLEEGVSIKQIIATSDTSILLLSNNKIMVCGCDPIGGFGLGDRSAKTTFVPINIHLPDNVSIKQIAANSFHILLLLSNNTVIVYGDNMNGHLGLGHTRHQPTFVRSPVDIPKNVSIQQIVTSVNNTFLLLSNNTVIGCGNNMNGQLGLGHTTRQTTFVPIHIDLPPNVSIQQIALASYHVILLLSDNTLMSCGANQHRQLGLGHNQNAHTFTRIPTLQ